MGGGWGLRTLRSGLGSSHAFVLLDPRSETPGIGVGIRCKGKNYNHWKPELLTVWGVGYTKDLRFRDFLSCFEACTLAIKAALV